MSALTPHIRVLRVEGAALATEADRFEEARKAAHPGDRDRFFIAELITRVAASAKFNAAEVLEALERERLNAAGLGPRDMADEVEQLKSEHPLTSRQTDQEQPK